MSGSNGVDKDRILRLTRQKLAAMPATPGWKPAAQTAVEAPKGGPIVSCFTDIEAREVDWLWRGRIPKGRLTLLVGRPGEGKSFLTVDMAARVSTGRPWPDGPPCEQGDVLFVTGEDDPHDTIRPRLDAAGADVGKVHLLRAVRHVEKDGGSYEVVFTLADVAALETAIQSIPACKLIVIDPIGSFLGGSTDAHRDNEVRAVLAPVAALAEKSGAAVVIVAHRRKAAGAIADDLALGSRAFTGICRAVWHLCRDTQDKTRRLLLSGKCNLAAESDGLAFRIGGEPPCLTWETGTVTVTANEVLAAENGGSHRGPDPEAREAAKTWLADRLAAGPVEAGAIKADAKGAEINWKTVQRAADSLGVRRRKSSFGGGWIWEIAPPDEGDTEGDTYPTKEKEPVLLSPSVGDSENPLSKKPKGNSLRKGTGFPFLSPSGETGPPDLLPDLIFECLEAEDPGPDPARWRT